MRILLIIIVNIFILACSQQSKIEGEVKIMDQTLIDNLKIIEKSKIYFGHQSVGFNIMDGLTDLIKEAGNDNISILETDGKQKLPEFYFAHSRVGKNTEPNTKCDVFADVLKEDFAQKLDFAFLKFCYVDMRREDNPQTVFEYYKSTIDSIKKKYPDLSIAHVTIPLTTIQTGWKVPFKKMFGKTLGGHIENMKRIQFNEILKIHYKDDPIFDLSKVESTYPDGSRESFEYEGKSYFALVPEYADGAGHLNEYGRKIAAKELIKVLAEAK